MLGIYLEYKMHKILKTLYSQVGDSTQNNIRRANNAAGIVDIQKQMRHLGKTKSRAHR